MQVTGIIVAAGKGQRMGMSQNKIYLDLQGKPILAYSLELFQRLDLINQIILVVAPGEEAMAKKIVENYSISKVKKIVVGGSSRFRSVGLALPYISCKSDYVAIHDGARPLLTANDFKKVLRAAETGQGAILATPVQDTIKQGLDGFVMGTIPRNQLWRALTPQVFPVELFLEAYTGLNSQVTDDSSLMEAIGAKIKIVEGSPNNIKITTPLDLKLAALLLAENNK